MSNRVKQFLLIPLLAFVARVDGASTASSITLDHYKSLVAQAYAMFQTMGIPYPLTASGIAPTFPMVETLPVVATSSTIIEDSKEEIRERKYVSDHDKQKLLEDLLPEKNFSLLDVVSGKVKIHQACFINKSLEYQAKYIFNAFFTRFCLENSSGEDWARYEKVRDENAFDVQYAACVYCLPNSDLKGVLESNITNVLIEFKNKESKLYTFFQPFLTEGLVEAEKEMHRKQKKGEALTAENTIEAIIEKTTGHEELFVILQEIPPFPQDSSRIEVYKKQYGTEVVAEHETMKLIDYLQYMDMQEILSEIPDSVFELPNAQFFKEMEKYTLQAHGKSVRVNIAAKKEAKRKREEIKEQRKKELKEKLKQDQKEKEEQEKKRQMEEKEKHEQAKRAERLKRKKEREEAEQKEKEAKQMVEQKQYEQDKRTLHNHLMKTIIKDTERQYDDCISGYLKTKKYVPQEFCYLLSKLINEEGIEPEQARACVLLPKRNVATMGLVEETRALLRKVRNAEPYMFLSRMNCYVFTAPNITDK